MMCGGLLRANIPRLLGCDRLKIMCARLGSL